MDYTHKPHLYSYTSPLLWIILFLIFIPTLNSLYNNSTIIVEWVLLNTSPTPIIFPIILDPLGLIFSCTVILISANVLSFSTIYIKDDPFINRFTILVLAFIISINLLIFIPHFIALLLGWDGLGLVSFILVVYYQNTKSLRAGIITALSNRIGDAIILVAIALTLNQGHWLIITIDLQSPVLALQVILIIVAAITKRAQIPFSRWLPAAIAAPTPVSALVHSSTLVTAGVFLLIRFYPFLHIYKIFNHSLLIIACITIFIAGIRATTECDIKKIIALSTLRQLGLIITRLGLNNPTLATFHIITHALFKALLFICAGSIINYHIHSQELRWIGNIPNQIPTIRACFVIANAALCGFPFIAGFYSKDAIIEFIISNPANTIIIIISFIRVGITAYYTIRFLITVIIRINIRTPFISIEEPTSISTPTLIISFCSITSGAALTWLFSPIHTIIILPIRIKLIPTLSIIIGASIRGLLTSVSKTKDCCLTKSIINHYASCIIWYLVPLSSQFILNSSLTKAHKTLINIDHGWLESPQLIYNESTLTDSKLINLAPIKSSSITLIATVILTSTIILWTTTH